MEASEQLAAKIATLEEVVAALEQQLAALRSRGFGSMRDTRRCPACGGLHLLHIRRQREATAGPPAYSALHYKYRFGRTTPLGLIESFACRSCGLVEYHASDFTGVNPDGKHIIAIDPDPGAPSTGPFR